MHDGALGNPPSLKRDFNEWTKRGSGETIFGRFGRKGTVPKGIGSWLPEAGGDHCAARLAVFALTAAISSSIPPALRTEEYSERRKATSLTDPSE